MRVYRTITAVMILSLATGRALTRWAAAPTPLVNTQLAQLQTQIEELEHHLAVCYAGQEIERGEEDSSAEAAVLRSTRRLAPLNFGRRARPRQVAARLAQHRPRQPGRFTVPSERSRKLMARSSGVRPRSSLTSSCAPRAITKARPNRRAESRCARLSALLVDGVELEANLEAERERRQSLPPRCRCRAPYRSRPASLARRDHQQRRLVLLTQRRIGAVLQQDAHHGDVARLGRAHQRRRTPRPVEVSPAVWCRCSFGLGEHARSDSHRVRATACTMATLSRSSEIRRRRARPARAPTRACACPPPRRAPPCPRCRRCWDRRRAQQHGGEVVVGVDDGEHERGRAIGIGQVDVSAARRPKRLPRPSRILAAAYISGVHEPSGSTDCPRRRRTKAVGDERALTSAPNSTSSGRRRHGSHGRPTSGRSRRRRSPVASTAAPFASSDPQRADRPVRAAVISTVSPLSRQRDVRIGAGRQQASARRGRFRCSAASDSGEMP